MIHTFRAFLKFCYIARKDTLTEIDLQRLERALSQFHHHRTIFVASGVRSGISLPRQHSLVHYPSLIRAFGAPNGLCSSITESKHIRSVKEPWRRSNRNEPLGQMLVTNQRLDQLSAAQTDFENRGMLHGTQASKPSCSMFIFLYINDSDVNLYPLTDPQPTTGHGSINEPINVPTQTSVADEDPLEEIITDLDAVAEVTLGSKPSSFHFFTNFLCFLTHSRIQVVSLNHGREVCIACFSSHVTTLSVRPAVPEFVDPIVRAVNLRLPGILRKSAHILQCDSDISCTQRHKWYCRHAA